MDGLDWQGAVKDIRASVNWLKANGSKKVCYFSTYTKSKQKYDLGFILWSGAGSQSAL